MHRSKNGLFNQSQLQRQQSRRPREANGFAFVPHTAAYPRMETAGLSNRSGRLVPRGPTAEDYCPRNGFFASKVRRPQKRKAPTSSIEAKGARLFWPTILGGGRAVITLLDAGGSEATVRKWRD